MLSYLNCCLETNRENQWVSLPSKLWERFWTLLLYISKSKKSLFLWQQYFLLFSSTLIISKSYWHCSESSPDALLHQSQLLFSLFYYMAGQQYLDHVTGKRGGNITTFFFLSYKDVTKLCLIINVKENCPNLHKLRNFLQWN